MLASVTISLTPSAEATNVQPQRKTIVITQAAAGGPYTVTWPSTGLPSNTSPTVQWAGGVAPVISAAAGATDVYLLETLNGKTWYGAARQASPPPVSGQYLCAPNSYAPGTRTAVTVNTTTMAAWSSANICTNTFTAPASGNVVVTADICALSNSVNGDVTGFGLAAHGTVTPLVANAVTVQAINTAFHKVTLVFYVTGLTPGSSYQFNLLGCCTSTTTSTIEAQGQTGTTVASGGPVTMTVQAV